MAPLLQRQLRRQRHDLAHQFSILRFELGQRWNVALGNHQEMNRRPRTDVMKDVDVFILIDLARRHLTGNDLAKNAIGRMAHGNTPFKNG